MSRELVGVANCYEAVVSCVSEGGDSEKLKLGEELWLVGYPSIGGWGSRPPITITRGIVSGFESRKEGVIVKTDAQLSDGASGGSALNGRFELIGIPSETVQEGYGDAAGQIGFIRPLSMLPSKWRELMDASNEQ